MPRRLIIRLLKIGAVVALGVAAVGAYATWRIWDQGSRDEARPAGAIVVLGAAQYDGRPSPDFQARLDHAIALFKSGIAPYLVVTGGKQPGDRTTEAATARAYALDRGVPERAILSEDQGRTTAESLHAVAAVLAAHRIDDVVFVSDPTHMLRVLLIARDEGIVGYTSPTRTSPVDAEPAAWAEAMAHELGGLAERYVVGPIAAWVGSVLPSSGDPRTN